MSNSKNISILSLVLALSVAGCTSKAQQPDRSTDDVQKSAGLVPCDTDSDCLEKNGELADDHAQGVLETCEAITAKGSRCTRRVPEAGLLCKQHSKMQNAGKVVKTIAEVK